MTECLIAEYESRTAAKDALERLERAHFTLENVSIVSDASDPAAEHLEGLQSEDDSTPASISAPEGRTTSLGMLIGGSIAAPIAAGTLIGPFIIAGPLVGMALGAVVGRWLGGMQQWGVSLDVSADYQKRVQAGAVLVIVHDVDAARLTNANEVLRETHPLTLEKYQVS